MEASRKVVHKALELGVTLLDTADSYGNLGGSENCLGQILGDRRKDIVLATKFGKAMDQGERLKGASRRYIISALEASLKRLKTDWIDLYQIHYPDPMTPIEETLRALDDLVRQGKIRYIGCCNFPAWQTVEAQWTAKHCNLNSFVSCQNEYSLIERTVDKELILVMQTYGLGLLPYFPLAGGFLTGKYRRNAPMPAGTRLTNNKQLASQYLTDANWQTMERLEKYCAERGHTLLELAIAWLAQRPTVSSVIAGATKPEQVELNVQAVNWRLAASDMAEIDQITARA